MREKWTLLHRWETMTDGSDRWSAWASMGESAPSCPAVGQNEDGNLEVFAPDVRDGSRINHRQQISRASDWLDWSSLDQPAFGYSTRTWQTDEGLPDNVVEAITQTQDGYLWVGTRAGLARFDGMSFTCFDTNNTPALRNSSITALCRDREGKLWIGTDGGGVACLAGRSFLALWPGQRPGRRPHPGDLRRERRVDVDRHHHRPDALPVTAPAGITPGSRGCSRIRSRRCSKIGIGIFGLQPGKG